MMKDWLLTLRVDHGKKEFQWNESLRKSKACRKKRNKRGKKKEKMR